MKILQLGKFYPVLGGVEKVMFDLTVGLYALTFPHGLNRQPDYLWLQIKNGVRNE